MGKGKPRHNPDKPQNNRVYPCPRYEEYSWGGCYCHGGDNKDSFMKMCAKLEH